MVLSQPGWKTNDRLMMILSDEVLRQKMLPRTFECIACRLKIKGLSKLRAAGLGDEFIATTTYSPADFFGLYTEEDLEKARNEFPIEEPDFNK